MYQQNAKSRVSSTMLLSAAAGAALAHVRLEKYVVAAFEPAPHPADCTPAGEKLLDQIFDAPQPEAVIVTEPVPFKVEPELQAARVLIVARVGNRFDFKDFRITGAYEIVEAVTVRKVESWRLARVRKDGKGLTKDTATLSDTELASALDAGCATVL